MTTKITKRLSRDTLYKKTNKTYQEKLSPDEIKKKLEEYSQVEDITNVDLNTHVRYFTFNPETGEKQFRLGGFLSKIDATKGYVICQNGNLSWSVQIKNTVFFQKMSFSELKFELEEKVRKKNNSELKTLKKENRKLKDALKEIKKKLKKN